MTDSLGIWLRRSREARKQDLDEVVRSLRIRRRYLQALEMGDYEALPGPIQARGFLRNYARFLGLSVEDVLARRVRGLQYDARASMEAAPTVARLLAKELERDEGWAEAQVETFRALAQGYLLTP